MIHIRVRHNVPGVEAHIRRVANLAHEYPQEIARALGEYMHALAIRYSSGTRNTYGYRPGLYSRLRPAQPDDYIINVRSGKLRDSWRMEIATMRNRARATLRNIALTVRGAPYPFFLFHGTRFMRKRPLPQKVRNETRDQARNVLARFAHRVKAAWGGRHGPA